MTDYLLAIFCGAYLVLHVSIMLTRSFNSMVVKVNYASNIGVMIMMLMHFRGSFFAIDTAMVYLMLSFITLRVIERFREYQDD